MFLIHIDNDHKKNRNMYTKFTATALYSNDVFDQYKVLCEYEWVTKVSQSIVIFLLFCIMFASKT